MKCKNCGNESDGSYKTKGKETEFCSEYCARSFATKKDNKKETKGGRCVECGNEIEVNKRADLKKIKCDSCKVKLCKVCGQFKPCKRPDICRKQNLFSSLEKYFGFDKDKLGTLDVYKEFDRVKNIVYEDYWGKELSIPEMVKKYKHYNSGNFTKILHSLGIETRNLSQSGLNKYRNGKIYTPVNIQYKHGGHTTWNRKKVFYRSSYELEYAKHLDEQQIDYEMENLRILYGDSQKFIQRTAIPDFYLPNSGTIVEIKSKGTYDEKNMRDKVKAYKEHGYKVKIIVEGEVMEMVDMLDSKSGAF